MRTININKAAGEPNQAAKPNLNTERNKYDYDSYRNRKQTFGFNSNKYFNRNLLPAPLNYYHNQFIECRNKKPNSKGYVMVHCPFHPDNNPSLSINLIHGGFKCFACGTCGGDILSFQMKQYKQTFKEAAIELGAWGCI